MSNQSDNERKLLSWLTPVFQKYSLQSFSVHLKGNSERGTGYLGDIVYVTAKGKAQDGSTKIYDLVLKCSKESDVLRKKIPIKDIFHNEIYFYTTVMPFFVQFQEENHARPFDNVPKCYGAFSDKDNEVLVLENLNKLGFELWPKKQPLTRKHLEIVLRAYGKFHATSVAINDKNPEQFEKIVSGFRSTSRKLFKVGDMQNLFGSGIDVACEVFQGDLEESVLNKYKSFKEQIDFVLFEMFEEAKGLKVICQGDCWNNNFMYKFQGVNKEEPSSVVIFDWQFTKHCSPIFDLSYFIFTCISAEDLENLNNVLMSYHKSFVDHLLSLGVDKADSIYPFEVLLQDWNQYCRYGILMSAALLKIVSTDKANISDIAEIVEDGQDYTHVFTNKDIDTETFKFRSRPIIEYVVKHNLI